jgi:uncharacterized cupredoxin-like copper-binding protein
MHIIGRHMLIALIATGLLVAATHRSLAEDQVVKVSLTDKGLELEMPTTLGMGMSGDMSEATMGIEVSEATLKAGKITFEVTNVSEEMIHEMVIAPVADPSVPLPYNADEYRVMEEDSGYLGEISDLDPLASGALTLTLKPGTYILLCNLPGHYMAGMWTLITVE